MFDTKIIEVLACPFCQGELEYINENPKECLKCKACLRKYPIEENIPVLLVERAILDD